MAKTDLERIIQQINNTPGLSQAEKADLRDEARGLAGPNGGLTTAEIQSMRQSISDTAGVNPGKNSGGSGGGGTGGGGTGGGTGGGGTGGGGDTITDVSQCAAKYGPPGEGFAWQLINGACVRVQSNTQQDNRGTAPGAAWTWDGTRWTRPAMPSDGKPYIWDDNLGWQIDSRLMASRTNARDYLTGLFKQFGFDDTDTKNLTGMIEGWISQGLADAGTEPVLMKFRDTDIYKRRFAGMAELIKRGQAISEAEYIQLESSYRNVMQNYGLPTTFYDRPDDYARLIGAGLSVREVEERVVAAKQSLNPLVAQELNQYYGVDQGTAMAYLLGLTDEKGVALQSARTQEQIRTGARAAQIGAAAESAGFRMDRTLSESLGGMSVGQTIDPFQVGTMAQLEGTFDQARRVADRETVLSGIDQEAYTEADTLRAAFGDDQARLASERRARRERARFGGSSAVGGGSLSVERNL